MIPRKYTRDARGIPVQQTYGATETAPFALAVNWPGASGGLVGLPMPGVTLKLALLDEAGVLEARLKGPSVTPGYWRDAEGTAQAFDEEGYYRYGDALAPADSQDLSKGLAFGGRIGENFKLATGTWVNVAGLRDRLMTATKGCLVDAVIATCSAVVVVVSGLEACEQPVSSRAIDRKSGDFGCMRMSRGWWTGNCEGRGDAARGRERRARCLNEAHVIGRGRAAAGTRPESPASTAAAR